MHLTNTGWAANIVGLLLLVAAAKRINVTPETRELLVKLLACGGLAISQALIWWAHRAPRP